VVPLAVLVTQLADGRVVGVREGRPERLVATVDHDQQRLLLAFAS